MRRLIVIEYLSLDGVAPAPGHAQEDTSAGFAHGGWTGPFMDEHGRYMREALNTMGALLLGRLTYEIWAGYWPTVTDPADEIARMFTGQVGELKHQPGKDIVLMGSSELAQTLIRHDLVDEYRLMIHPVVLGSGKRLFRDSTPMSALRLIEAATTSSGLVTLTHEPARR